MNIKSVLTRNLVFYWPSLTLVVIGVAIASAVITGALLVGDSVRGSLRYLAIDRLGQINQIILAPRFVESDITERVKSLPDLKNSQPVGAIYFPSASIETIAKENNQISVAGGISVIGIESSFRSLQSEGKNSQPFPIPKPGEVVLNATLASELGVSIDSSVTIRLPKEQAVSADSPLGRPDDQTEGLPSLKVIEILPDEGLARFDIRASQLPTKNAFVAISDVQFVLDRPSQINTVFLNDPVADQNQDHSLESRAQFTLGDFGLEIERVQLTLPDIGSDGDSQDDPKNLSTAFDYFQITSSQLLMNREVSRLAMEEFSSDGATPVMTYLANGIAKVSIATDESDIDNSLIREIPYSIVTGVDFSKAFNGPGFRLGDLDQKTLLRDLNEDRVAVNSWLAEQMKLKIGDTVRLFYFLPESTHDQDVEKYVDFVVDRIVPITEPSRPYRRNRAAVFSAPPTAFNDTNLTPTVPGITDQESITDWDLPFALTRKIETADDEYWNDYRLTPKLFLNFNKASELFGSRFGNVSSIRIPIRNLTKNQIEARLKKLLGSQESLLGLKPIPVRQMQLNAASGTTPFDYLFLSLSFFVIVAALLLVSLLFRFSIEQRIQQFGTLLSIGWTDRNLARMLRIEGLLLAAIGSAIGVAAGIGYGKLLIAALKGWWVGAVSVPFLEFFVTPLSLLIGFAVGFIVCWLTISITIRRIRKQPARALLQGRLDESAKIRISHKQTGSSVVRQNWNSWPAILGVAMLVASLAAVGIGWTQTGQAQAGAFLGSGMLILTGLLLLVFDRIGTLKTADRSFLKSFSLNGLAGRAMQRNPLRSSLSVGLMAIASFLVLSLTLFQAKPDAAAVGGYQLQAVASIPIGGDLNSSGYKQSILGAAAEQLSGVTVDSFRVLAGDDASCNNLYQSTQPRLLGATTAFIERQSNRTENGAPTFPWAGHAKLESDDKSDNDNQINTPWQLLEKTSAGTEDDPIPVIVDLNTAMWALHKGAAVGKVFSFEFTGGGADNRTVYFETVGLLQNTVLQGSLILHEANLIDTFPAIEGHAFFMIDVSKNIDINNDEINRVSQFLESNWSDSGLDVVTTNSVLRQLLAVQNTYLSAFQALGTLGVLLGTFGLALVQFRSVLERRGELGVMSAIGYGTARIRRLLILETSWLLFGGIIIGVFSALLSLIPAWLNGQATAAFLWPAMMICSVAVVGILAAWIAILRAQSQPVLDALRAK